MRVYHFILLLILFSVVLSCEEDDKDLTTDVNGPELVIEPGVVIVNFSINDVLSEEQVSLNGRASDVEVQDFVITLYESNTDTIVSTIENLTSDSIAFEIAPGTYYLVSKNESETKSDNFAGSTDSFDVTSNNQTKVALEVSPAFIQLTVSFSDEVKSNFTSYGADISSGSEESNIDETQNETIIFSGYESILISAYAEGLNLTSRIENPEIGKHYIVNIDFDPRGLGGLSFNKSGIYLFKHSKEGDASAVQLVSTKVENEGFSAQERDGFYSATTYLESGTYQFLTVEDFEVLQSLGGQFSSQNDTEFPDLTYDLIDNLTEDDSFEVTLDGLYFVTFDERENESIFMSLQSMGIIGNAVYLDECTSDFWASDLDLDLISSTRAKSVWEKTVLLRAGEYKIRMNDAWKIDRRKNPNQANSYSAENGYVAFLHYGGDPENLTEGDLNLTIAEDANYSVTVELENSEFLIDLVRADAATPCPFDPANFAWGIIGSATTGNFEGWENDIDLTYFGIENDSHIWKGVFPLHDDEESNAMFKFRTNDAWITQISAGTFGENATVIDLTEPGTLSDNSGVTSDGNWIAENLTGGFLYVEIATDDEGATWTVTFDEAEFEVIGLGSPSSSLASGLLMEYNNDINNPAFVITGDFTTQEWNVRKANDDGFIYGTDAEGINAVLDGLNFTLPETANYTVKLFTIDGGQSYQFDIQKN